MMQKWMLKSFLKKKLEKKLGKLKKGGWDAGVFICSFFEICDAIVISRNQCDHYR